MQEIKSDILIIGAGGAGLFAALHALEANPALEVTVAVKGLLGKCGCTRMVQGGYNVALAPGDSLERHFMDTIEGGKWLPDQDLAWRLVEGAQERIRELENELGCFFDRNPDGSLHQKAFAGQSFDRTVHKGDLTGIEIINRLMEQVWALPIQRLEEHRALALIPTADGAAQPFLQNGSGHARFRPGEKAGRVELHHLHIAQGKTRTQRHSQTVAGLIARGRVIEVHGRPATTGQENGLARASRNSPER